MKLPSKPVVMYNHMARAIILLIVAVSITGCNKKSDAPKPQENESTNVAENTEKDVIDDTQNAPENAVDALKTENLQDILKSWTNLGKEIRCLNLNGCDYHGPNAPMRTVYADGKLYCDHKLLPDKWSNMRCLDSELYKGYFFVEEMKDRFGLRCIADSCICGDKTLRKGELCVGNGKGLTEPEITLKDLCEPSHLPESAMCKDNQIFCGDEAFSGDYKELWEDHWRCVNNSWLCMIEGCQCGEQKVGKFGTCKNNIAMCGDQEMQQPPAGYICQKNKWVCAKPGGCEKCAQFQSLNADGECEGKDTTKIVADIKACEKGNCPCGDGACPAGGKCIKLPDKTAICACGEYDYYYSACKAEDGNSDSGLVYSYPLYSNKYGEFECTQRRGDGYIGDTYYDVYCANEKGCKILGDETIIKNQQVDDDDDECNPAIDECYPDGIKATSDISSDDQDVFNQLFMNLQLQKSGRRSATEFEGSIDSAAVRTLCDTMPVPRANRKDYKCEYGPEIISCPEPGCGGHDEPVPYLWPGPDFGSNIGNNCVFYATDDKYRGLRCKSEDGCICNQERCPQNSLCYNGTCSFDSEYAGEICNTFIPRLAQDEENLEISLPEVYALSSSIGPYVYLYSPSDKENFEEYGYIRPVKRAYECFKSQDYDYTDKIMSYTSDEFFALSYLTNVTNTFILPNGTCMCGYSEFTPDPESNQDDYQCVQSLGYVCVSEDGCECGDAKCNQGSLCLRKGLCSPVVQTEGFDEPTGTDLENAFQNAEMIYIKDDKYSPCYIESQKNQKTVTAP